MLQRRLFIGFGASATLLLPSPPAGATPGPARQAASRPRAPLPVVVLDPGHGGKDPGAIGVSGTYEKHIAFAAAQELQRQLLASGRYRVEVTRGQDVFIPLEERVAIAQAHGASLFMSMHADAINDPGVRGASVYTLAGTASDAQTAALAQRENSADRFAGGRYGGGQVSPEVAHILASLVRQETRLGSARMAQRVVGALHQDVGLLQNPARHAAFVVLKAADIPSVLVEMGFMSNREDEAALRRPDHRAQVAAALKRAVDGYFADNGALVTAG